MRFLGLALSVFLVACGKNASEPSKLAIFGGEVIDATRYPAVVQIKEGKSLCTATFVTPDTAITAAHCVLNKNSRQAKNGEVGSQISLAKDENIKSKKIYAHSSARYSKSGFATYKASTFDVALVVFKDFASSAVEKISRTKPQVRDDVTLIGFGLPYRGQKQIGFNEVARLAPGLIFTVLDQDSDEDKAALLGPGDSGGPLFIKQKIAGIGSSGNAIASFHTDLTSETVSEFLREHLPESAFE